MGKKRDDQDSDNGAMGEGNGGAIATLPSKDQTSLTSPEGEEATPSAESKRNRQRGDGFTCPKCQSDMFVQTTRRANGRRIQYWGCTKCKASKKVVV